MPKYRVYETVGITHCIVVDANNQDDACDIAAQIDLEHWEELDFQTISTDVEEIND